MASLTDRQKAAARRRLGRKLIVRASQVKVSLADFHEAGDRAQLTDKELAVLDKLVAHIQVATDKLDQLGVRLDK